MRRRRRQGGSNARIPTELHGNRGAQVKIFINELHFGFCKQNTDFVILMEFVCGCVHAFVDGWVCRQPLAGQMMSRCNWWGSVCARIELTMTITQSRKWHGHFSLIQSYTRYALAALSWAITYKLFVHCSRCSSRRTECISQWNLSPKFWNDWVLITEHICCQQPDTATRIGNVVDVDDEAAIRIHIQHIRLHECRICVQSLSNNASSYVLRTEYVWS